MRHHECGKRYCKKCKMMLPYEHECCFPVDRKILHANNKAPPRYFAYDIESVLKEVGVREIPFMQDGVQVLKQTPCKNHFINCIVVQEMFIKTGDVFAEDGSHPELFHNFQDFFQWCKELPEENDQYIFFAHNNSKYDARMLMLAYNDLTGTLPDIQWANHRILSLTLPHPNPAVKLRFRDSMLHISGGLAQFVKTFGLPETSKKGFFPYHLNQFENIIYPDIPDIEHFEPDHKPEKVRQQLIEWHASMKGKPYDVQKELEGYCIQDVLLEKQGLEVYMKSGIETVQQISEKHRDIIVNPLSSLTVAGHCLTLYQALDYDPIQFPVFPLSEEYSDMIQEAFHGGRTDVRCTYYKRKAGEKIYYLDIVSLYPSVQMFDPMPYGSPVLNENPCLEDLQELYGFAKIDFEVLEYHFHPVCTLTVDGKLRADLLDKIGIVESSPKIQWMLQRPHLYRITRVYWTMAYKKTLDMFRSYMNRCLMNKSLANETLDREKSIEKAQEFYDHSNGALDFRHVVESGKLFEKNPGIKALAKLEANSLWGKIGQRSFEEYTHVCHLNPSQFELASVKELHGTIRFVHPPQLFTNRETQEEIYLCCLEGEDKNNIIPGKENFVEKPRTAKLNNKAIAAMVTASAQIRLLTAMEMLGERVLYHDTDSIVCVIGANEEIPPGIIQGTCLGEWELEHPTELEENIDEFVALASKAYAIRFSNPDVPDLMKIKGCGSLDTIRNDHVNFDAMRDMVCGLKEKFFVEGLDIRFYRDKLAMKSSTQAKMVRQIEPKGVLVGKRIFPLGYDRFELGKLTAQKYALE